MTIQKELTSVQKKLTAIKLKVDNIITAVEKGETKFAKPSKAKAVKAKPAKKAPKAPAKELSVKVTATDQVLNFIYNSEKGIDAPTLAKETGFNQKKVTNILQRKLKEGKIQRAERGIYVGVKQG